MVKQVDQAVIDGILNNADLPKTTKYGQPDYAYEYAIADYYETLGYQTHAATFKAQRDFPEWTGPAIKKRRAKAGTAKLAMN